MRTAEILDEDILNIFRYQGMATSKQIADLLNISYTKANRVSKKLWEREARLINRTTEKRLWNVDTNRAGAPEYLYYLNEAGAQKVTELTGEKITAPSMLIKKNIVHAIALVDIVNISIKMGGTVRVNRRIYGSEDAETYIRPDIEYSPKGEKKYFIEFEQSRVKMDLENKILERMRRWQKILTKEQGNDQYFKEIFVLFNLEETDNYTLRIWAKAYETLYKELNTPPEFIVWYKPFKEFYAAPSFNLNEYTRLTMGDVHISTILTEEKKKDIVRLTNR
jgi:DNA-binding MarR family transcriptional regulator